MRQLPGAGLFNVSFYHSRLMVKHGILTSLKCHCITSPTHFPQPPSLTKNSALESEIDSYIAHCDLLFIRVFMLGANI